MKRWKQNIIMTGSLSIIMVGLGVILFNLWATPIKDATLREDILHTLHLEAYMDNKRRPTKEDLQQLTTLTSNRAENDEQKVNTLKGLQYATKLEELAIQRGKFTDLTPLQSLTELRTLKLNYHPEDEGRLYEFIPAEERISNIDPISDLTNLQTLNLGESAIEDFSPLKNLNKLTYLSLANAYSLEKLPAELGRLTNLKELILDDVGVEDITALETLTSLEVLSFRRNRIDNFTPLTKLVSLRSLQIELDGEIDGTHQITFLEHLENLEELTIHLYRVEDYSPLGTLKKLRHLSVHQVEEANPAFLSQLPKLESLYMPHADIVSIEGIEHAKNLKLLNVGFNRIQSLEPLRDLCQLERIDFHDNMITTVEPLKNLTKLKHIKLSDNSITDITPLKALTNLESLYVYHNRISSIQVVENFPKLDRLHVMGNNISDISPVTHLPNLSLLDVRNNYILFLQPVETLLNLKELRIEGNNIENSKWLQQFVEEHPDVEIDVLQNEE